MNWNRIWKRRQKSKKFHNSGTRRAPDRYTNSAAFVKRVVRRRRRNEIAKASRKRNRTR